MVLQNYTDFQEQIGARCGTVIFPPYSTNFLISFQPPIMEDKEKKASKLRIFCKMTIWLPKDDLE